MIPGEVRSRLASPFFYAELATRYESERLTEDDRDILPERINELRPARFNNWLSEREWMRVMMETAGQPRKLLLKIDVNETNTDYLKNASCEEIFTTRQREYQESYWEYPQPTSYARDMATQPTAKSTSGSRGSFSQPGRAGRTESFRVQNRAPPLGLQSRPHPSGPGEKIASVSND